MVAEKYAGLVAPQVVGLALAKALDDERWLESTATLIAGGKSNLTYELTSRAGSVILRRPPSGDLLPRAHDMGREARIQQALAQTDVPVPEVIMSELSGDVMGVPFYVMRKVEGHVIRDTLPSGYASSAKERVALTEVLVHTLADLHAIRAAEVGLDDFGRPDNFMQRQIRRWYAQWEKSKTDDVAAVDALATRLAGCAFSPTTRSAIVHGDFRLDNCLMDPRGPGRVAAVLDWELSTLGDPLADLGMLLFYWCEAGEPTPVLTPAITASSGFPGRDHVVQAYAERTGADLRALNQYVAFAHFKFAVIAQGISARAAADSMGGQQFGDLDEEILRIAQSGLEYLNQRS